MRAAAPTEVVVAHVVRPTLVPEAAWNRGVLRVSIRGQLLPVC